MLEMRGVGHFHRPDRWLFRDVTLTVVPGRVTVVLGPNGTGKSTFARCAAGLLSPVEGVVSGASVGYVPQSHAPAFAYSVLDMVVMGRARHVGWLGTPRRADFSAAREALARVGAGHLAERAYVETSGGERQLVLIARAIVSDSKTLVLDEPCSALDLSHQLEVLHLLGELAQEGWGIFMTTHHPDHARELADEVVLMPADAPVRTGPASELLTDDAVGALYGVGVRTVTFTDPSTSRTRYVTATWRPTDDTTGSPT